jgi:hypothetical protein
MEWVKMMMKMIGSPCTLAWTDRQFVSERSDSSGGMRATARRWEETLRQSRWLPVWLDARPVYLEHG